ncbi:MAG: methionyl-tRNA formyltransferase, partial [Francisellaceae bacterium]
MEEKMSVHKICMLGCTEAGHHIIEFLLHHGISIDHFVTIAPERASNLNISGYKNFESLAKSHNIPIYYPQKYHLKTREDIAFFQEHKFDLIVQGGWQRLIPEEILSSLSIGAIGVHGSSDFLPRGRGRSPMNWSILEGKKRFILQLFMMQPGADNGDIFAYEQFDINEHDTIKTLYYKNAIITKRLLLEYIPKLLTERVSFKKQTGMVSYYPKRTPEDGQILW